jgi:hypothetical protein
MKSGGLGRPDRRAGRGLAHVSIAFAIDEVLPSEVMSEYQYYEFQAIDRPLSDADRQALRDLSTRARITATSFTNSYEWGDFKGDSAKLVERWFDLHLYVANWGSRRLMIRWPARLVDRDRLDDFVGEVDGVGLGVVGEYLILDIVRDEVEFEDWDDGSGWLAALTPLRAEVLAGDYRLFYLLWLTAVEADAIAADEPEPMPGIGPLTGALEAFANFFGIDSDLVQAAAERSATSDSDESLDSARHVIAVMTEREKTGLLYRLFAGDPHVAAELRSTVRKRLESETACSTAIPRTAGELRDRARASISKRIRRPRNGESRLKPPRKSARPGSKRSGAGVKASGKRSRMKLSAETRAVMTGRRPF